jgi:NADPH:quinone reductase-like Zn-dependent oxidoreductase
MNMKAFAIAGRDGQPAIQDIAQPEPAAGEVLIAVEAASVNGFDLSVAAGYVWDMIPHEFPVVLGRDLVGTISAVGQGVDTVAVGDLVAAVIPGMGLGPRTGSLTEYVAVPATAVTRVPKQVDAHTAAVIGLAGIAAHDAVAALNIQPGETVLVSGATGGVGSIALQLAAANGATVIATGRAGQEEDYVRGLGAAHVVDYTGDLVTAVQTIAAEGVDKALHAAGDPAVIGNVIRASGTVATTLGATNQAFGRDDLTVAAIMAAATGEKLAQLLDRVADGKVRVNVEATVPLDRAHEAFKHFADGTLGKVLVTP